MDKTPGVRVPAPIFNRRRPRQALFAHPNNANTSGDGPSVFTHGDKQGSGMEQSGKKDSFTPSSYRSTTTSASQSTPRPISGSNNQYPRPGPPANHRPPSMGAPQSNKATTPGQNEGYQSKSGGKLHNQNAYNSVRHRGLSSTMTSQQRDCSSPYGNSNNFSLFQPSNAQKTPGIPKSNNYTGGQNNYFSTGQNFGNSSHNTAIASVKQHNSSRASGDPVKTGGGQEKFGDDQPRYEYCPTRQETSSSESTFKHDYAPHIGQQPWGMPSLPTTNTAQVDSWTPASTPLKDTSHSSITSDTQISTKTVDSSSLHFITATIQGMKHWNKFAHKISMVFEIFGTLNSAVSTNSNLDQMQFVVKDDKASLNCIFFQIDRHIPRLIRTQWHRCVGTFNEHTQVFRCVSVRPAEQAEIKLYKAQVTASDQIMRELVTG